MSTLQASIQEFVKSLGLEAAEEEKFLKIGATVDKLYDDLLSSKKKSSSYIWERAFLALLPAAFNDLRSGRVTFQDLAKMALEAEDACAEMAEKLDEEANRPIDLKPAI